MRADNPVRSSLVEDRRYGVGITGAGAANPTKRYGPNVTVTRTAAGVYKFQWSGYPGHFKGFRHGLRADTPGNVKNFSVTGPAGLVDNAISLSVWNAAGTATDLAAGAYLDVEFEFTESSAT
jgi:hypothetical protein